jgi:hypothetical protein
MQASSRRASDSRMRSVVRVVASSVRFGTLAKITTGLIPLIVFLLQRVIIVHPVKKCPIFYSCVDMIPPLVLNVCQMIPAHTFPPRLFEIDFNVILPTTPRPFTWSLLLHFFLPELRIRFSSLPYVLHGRPSYSRFIHAYDFSEAPRC